MSTYRDNAVVLGSYKFGEADRVVVLLTQEHGKIRAVAKGVRKTKSSIGARLEPMSHVDVSLRSGKDLDTVSEVRLVHTHSLTSQMVQQQSHHQVRLSRAIQLSTSLLLL